MNFLKIQKENEAQIIFLEGFGKYFPTEKNVLVIVLVEAEIIE